MRNEIPDCASFNVPSTTIEILVAWNFRLFGSRKSNRLVKTSRRTVVNFMEGIWYIQYYPFPGNFGSTRYATTARVPANPLKTNQKHQKIKTITTRIFAPPFGWYNRMETPCREDVSVRGYRKQHSSMNNLCQAMSRNHCDDSVESGIDCSSLDGEHQSTLVNLMESYDWASCLTRIASHPWEARIPADQARAPLHVACDLDAPAVVLQSLLKAYPEASVLVGFSKMNALHITCTSQHASQHVVRVLLEGGLPEQSNMRDVDGDTPLHTACRCGAPIEVLEVLLRANPSAVHERDCEGLTPLLRLWVRYTVILGAETIDAVCCMADLQGSLQDAWNKTELLLRCAHYGTPEEDPARTWRVVHAASAVDCPRSVLRMAARCFRHQLCETDEYGRTPLLIAAQAPVYTVRDLSETGYTAEDVVYDDESRTQWTDVKDETEDNAGQPSVIEILLQENREVVTAAACIPDPLGRLPLHVALTAGKRWNEGLKQLVDAFPDALLTPDSTAKLYPFMLAAEGWKGDVCTTYELLRRNPTLSADAK